MRISCIVIGLFGVVVLLILSFFVAQVRGTPVIYLFPSLPVGLTMRNYMICKRGSCMMIRTDERVESTLAPMHPILSRLQ
ncbi:hypothetical protein JAAARDRAFT_663922 [Jaapia argillacea MUCL 33604]|uniref:Uncharacterized protein n=1 Tax=Jaapia argillacea MUCL 33604 TaxID=933084 RepID=A0A067PFB8_9AGAM|nr:hypothetical protein JAAARDRAFT_663922 [Jaapia argillacea MUCL 33604]